MALFAWLPLFLLQLFSAILGMDLHYLPAFSKIEVLRWHQPICTSASPCNTYESRNYDVDQVQKVLNVREVRESIDFDELEPSTIDSPVIYEKLYEPEHSDDARSKRHFSGRYLPNDVPPAILVTKVIDSPVTATITGRNCIHGVPSCVDGPTYVPIQLPPQQRYVLQQTYDSVVQTLSDARAGQDAFVANYARKKDQVIQNIIDEVSHKKEAVVQAVESVKQSIVDELSQKKDAIVGAVTSAAAAKHEFVQGIIDKKKEKVQPIIDAINEKKDKIVGVVAGVAATKFGYVQAAAEKVNEKKEQLVETVSDAVAAKKEFVEGIVQKKKDKVQAVKDKIAEAVEAKHEFVEGIVEKKKEKIQAVVDKVHEKKDQIVAAVSGAVESKKELVEGIVEKKHEKLQEKKDKIVEVVSNAAAAKKEFVEGIIEKKHEKLQEEKDKITEVLADAAAAKKEFVEGILEKKHEKLQEKKDKIIEVATDAAAAKKEFVEGIIEKKKEKLQEKKDKVVAAVYNAAAAKKEFVEGIVEKKKEKLQQKKDEITEAASSIVQAAIDKKQEKIQDIKDGFSHLSAEKQAAVQKVINKTQHVIHEFEEAKEKAEQDLAQKKQEFIQSIADKKIAAIKHVSEKAQEYIGTASLIKPLIASQIKQTFNGNEEQFERKIDEGDDFVFVDEDGNEVPAEETQGRTIGLFKKFILKKKFKPTGAHNESIEAAPHVDAPVDPVVLTQEAESTIPEANNPIEQQEIVEVPISSTTEEIVSVTENHEVPAVGPTGIEVPEQVATSSSHEENVHEDIEVSATSSATHEQTSNAVHEQATISQASASSSFAQSHEEVAINIDTPTTVASNVVYVPLVVEPIPATPVVVHQVPVVQATPVIVQSVPVVQLTPAVPCDHPSTVVEVPTSDTFTFNADIHWIGKSSGKDNIESANVTEEVAAKSANVEGPVVEGKSAQVDFDEIVPKNADVDEFIAQLLSKLVSDEDVAANSHGVLAKNADVDAADSKSTDEEVVAKNVAVKTESAPVDVEKVADHEEVVTKK